MSSRRACWCALIALPLLLLSPAASATSLPHQGDLRADTGTTASRLVQGVQQGVGQALLLPPVRTDAGLVPPLPPPPGPPAAPTPTPAPSRLPSRAVQDLLALVNRDRALHHVPPLALSLRQSGCSQAHSVHMARLGTLSHDQFPQDVCIVHRVAGENVGVAQGEADAAAQLLHRTMMSEGPCRRARCTQAEFRAHGHYLNLVNPGFKLVGIGIVNSGQATWLTEDFTG